jgi:hypothetical protein
VYAGGVYEGGVYAGGVSVWPAGGATAGGAGGAKDSDGAVNVGGAGGAAGASAAGPVNLPIPGKRSPTVSGLCPGMLTDGVGEDGGAAAGAVGTVQSVVFGGAAVSHPRGAGCSAAGVPTPPGAPTPGAGTSPSATSRGSTSSVIRSPGYAAAYVG